ncbi:MAG: transposase [Tannerella sp.]|nr:transposase [Tannerella sp.]
MSVFFLPPYFPELNPIEILWRRIKYGWIPFDACLCFQNLKERLSYVLANFGVKYDIIFQILHSCSHRIFFGGCHSEEKKWSLPIVLMYSIRRNIDFITEKTSGIIWRERKRFLSLHPL